MLHYLPEEWRHAIRDALLAELDVEAPDFACPAEAPAALSLDRSPHELALGWLEELWASHVQEPKGQGWQKIDDLIRGPKGLGWNTADARNWTPGRAYDENGIFAWCGAPGARALGEFGLRAEIRSKRCASTVRLFNFCKGTPRDIAIQAARPGDIGVVSAGVKKQGEHIVMIQRIEGGLAYTIEGNARGVGPDGRIFEGVVKRTRPLPRSAGGPGRDRSALCPVSGLTQRAELVHVYRFQAEDFATAA